MSFDWQAYNERRRNHRLECEFCDYFEEEVYCSCWSKDHFCVACNKVFCRDCGSLVTQFPSFLDPDEPPTRREKEFRTSKFKKKKKWNSLIIVDGVKNVKCLQNVINVTRQI
jgi:hypothetical protein